MDIVIPLDEMTTAEKLRALEQIWDDLCREPGQVPSPSWHADILKKREQGVQDGGSGFQDWSEAKKRIRGWAPISWTLS